MIAVDERAEGVSDRTRFWLGQDLEVIGARRGPGAVAPRATVVGEFAGRRAQPTAASGEAQWPTSLRAA